MGINTSSQVNLNTYEKLIAGGKQIPKELRPFLAGICKVSRLSRSFPDIHSQTIWNTGSNVIGPCAFFFTWWVLKKAREKKIKRLYFLARDGLVFLKIANIIKEHLSFDIECKYLYGSRPAWLIPSIKEIDKTEIKWILSDWWYTLSIKSVCQRIDITPNELKPFLCVSLFERNNFEEKLSLQEKKFLEKTLMSEKFNIWFQKKIGTDFNNIKGYFQQEGLCDNIPYGLVDIGWKGSQQVMINKILNKIGVNRSCPVKGFYLGMLDHKNTYKTYLDNNFEAFLFDFSSSLRNFSSINNHLFEALVAPPENRTLSFIYDGTLFFPKISKQSYPKITSENLQMQQDSILNFCNTFLTQCPFEFSKIENYNPIISKIVSQFIYNPSRNEAKTYGSFSMDGEMTENNIQEIAPVVSRMQFWKKCFFLKEFNLFWVQASLVRSHLYIEQLLWKGVLPCLMIIYFTFRKIQNFFYNLRKTTKK